MPQPFNEYGAKDWLRLRPLVHRYKHARFLFQYARIVRQKARQGDIPALIRRIRGVRLLTTIAFNDPAKIELQTRAVKTFVPDCFCLVADNSSDDALARQIAHAAAAHGAGYLRLPRAPWTGSEAGLSHGLGMTWVWRNLIRPAEPSAFGFIDHDIYPTAPDDPFAPLAEYPVAGRVWPRPPRWHLWAGFCFFRFDAVRDKNLNFIRDWFANLDTGGGNWHPLFRHLDPGQVPDPGLRIAGILPGVSMDDCRVEWIGAWLHEHNDWRHLNGPVERDFMKEKALAVAAIVDAALDRTESRVSR